MKRLSETFAAFIFTLSLLAACGSTEGSHPGYHPGTGTGTSISTSTSTGSGTGTGTSTGTGTTTTVHANLMGGAIQKQLTLTGAVTTFAGSTGVSGSTDGTGTAALFYHPYVVTTDGTNLYVGVNQTIRKIVINTGVVTTLAGSSGVTENLPGSSDGTGTAARFYGLQGITTDGTNLYVVDGEYTIRKVVIATGVVTTLAGSAYPETSAGYTDGTGASARFYNPQGITTDGTNLYVVDLGNRTIRKVVISTGVVTTLAGSVGGAGTIDGTGTSAQFYRPVDITTDGTDLYVTDSYTIRKVVIATGVVTTLADGTGTVASYDYAYGITMDGTNLYVTNHFIHIIQKVVIATGVVTTVAGSEGLLGSADGTGTTAQFNYPAGITTDGANLYVVDSLNNTIRKIR